ncbi:cytochrome P450 [Mycena olivaceomarginata]|nr:cytochrome P450 [Mycena olivaceomarginata]
MTLPPGIVYLSKQLPRVLAPPLVVFCAKLVVELRFGIVVPAWLAALAYVLISGLSGSPPSCRHGAIMPPSVPGYIGGINMLFMKNEDMYPGEPLVAAAENIGYTMTWRFLFQNRIMTAEPDNIKAILATEFNSFEKGSEFRMMMEPLLGTGVFAADGKVSLSLICTATDVSRRRHVEIPRQMTRPFFHRERISDFDLFDHHAENAIAQFKARLREGRILPVLSFFRIGYGCEIYHGLCFSFLFGQNVRSLDAGLPYPYNVSTDTSKSPAAAHPSSAFATAFQEAQTITALRSRFGEHWPLSEFWVDRLEEPMSIVRGFLDPILEEAVAKKRAMSAGMQENNKKMNELDDRQVEEGESLLDHLVNYTDDHTILADEILNITAAGRDTTAGLLTFTIYMLTEHPEILTNFEKKSYALTAVQPARFRSNKDERPLFVPAGTRCAFSTILMHRRKDLWGPDALQFDPERFLDERLHKYLTPNPFIFLPFNAGPRICLGQQFAYHESSFFLIRLLQTFSSVSFASDAQPPEGRPPASWKTDDKAGLEGHTRKIRTALAFDDKAHGWSEQGGLWVRMEEASVAEGV